MNLRLTASLVLAPVVCAFAQLQNLDINIVRAVADEELGLMYGISAERLWLANPPRGSDESHLVVYGLDDGVPARAVPIASSAANLAVSPLENRIYIAHWRRGEVSVFDRTSLSEVARFRYQAEDPAQGKASDVYGVAALRPGRLLMWSLTAPVKVRLVSSASGAILAHWTVRPFSLRSGQLILQGDGRSFLFAEGTAGAKDRLFLVDTDGDQFTVLKEADGYDSANPAEMTDEPRLAIGSSVFNENLDFLYHLGGVTRAVTSDGYFAISSLDVTNVYNLLVPSNLSVGGGQAQVLAESLNKLWIFRQNRREPSMVNLSLLNSSRARITTITNRFSSHATSPTVLEWEHDPYAVRYQVYYGRTEEAVEAADPGSELFLAETSGTSVPLPEVIPPGEERFWRVDAVGRSGPHRNGAVPLRISPVRVSPPKLVIEYVAGERFLDVEVELAGSAGLEWRAWEPMPWLTISNPSGTVPDTLRLRIDSARLELGESYEGEVLLTFGGGEQYVLPVEVSYSRYNTHRSVADPERPLVYSVGWFPRPGDRGVSRFLFAVDAHDGQILRAVPIADDSVRHMSIDVPGNRIYLTNHGENSVQVIDRDSFQTLDRWEFPPRSAGNIIGSVVPGRSNRVMLIELAGSNGLQLLNSRNGSLVSQSFFDGHPFYFDLKNGAGTFDPTGRWFYFAEQGDLYKFDTSEDFVRPVESYRRVNGEPRSGSAMLRNADGTRYFCGGTMIDPDLKLLWDYGAINRRTGSGNAFATDAEGSRIFVSSAHNQLRVFDVEARKYLFGLHQAPDVVYSRPANTLVDAGARSVVKFEPLLEPVPSFPGLVWANAGRQPWQLAPEQEAGVIGSTPGTFQERGSHYGVHIPEAATVRFDWRVFNPDRNVGELKVSMDNSRIAVLDETTEWATMEIDVPDGGHSVEWVCDGYNREGHTPLRGFLRHISIVPKRISIADGDGDGYADMLEWATGSDPTEAAVLPSFSVTRADGRVVLAFNLRRRLPGVSAQVEVSDDLQEWVPLAESEIRAVAVDEAFDRITATLSAHHPAQFARLRVQVAP